MWIKSFFTACLLFLSGLIYGQSGISYYNAGLVLMNEGKYQQALEQFELGIQEADAATSANLGGKAYCLLEMGELEKSEASIKQALKTELINSEALNSQFYWLWARISEDRGDGGKALEAYEKAISYSPDDLFLKTTYGLVLIEEQQVQKGVSVLNRVIDQDPNEPYARNNRALGNIQLKKFDLAKVDLDKSASLDNENPFLYKHYFLYYKAIGQKEKACKCLEQALAKNMANYGSNKDSDELNQILTDFCGEEK